MTPCTIISDNQIIYIILRAPYSEETLLNLVKKNLNRYYICMNILEWQFKGAYERHFIIFITNITLAEKGSYRIYCLLNIGQN